MRHLVWICGAAAVLGLAVEGKGHACSVSPEAGAPLPATGELPTEPTPVSRIQVIVGDPRIESALLNARKGTDRARGASSSCFTAVESVVVDVTVRVAEDYRPYRARTTFATEEPATDWELAGRETDVGPGALPVVPLAENLTHTYRLARPCGASALGTTATFSALVQGVEGSDAHAKVDVRFPECSAIRDDGGCAISPRGGSAAGVAGLALALGALAGRRLRRGRIDVMP